MVLVNFWRYPDPYQRFLIRIRIRPNDTDPTGSGSGSETLLKKYPIKKNKQNHGHQITQGYENKKPNIYYGLHEKNGPIITTDLKPPRFHYT